MAGIIDNIKSKVESLTQPSGAHQTHKAAILPSKGARFHIEGPPTLKPKDNEILVQVKSVALNPVDVAQREFDFHTSEYPGVLGSDVGGIVAAVGASVSRNELV